MIFLTYIYILFLFIKLLNLYIDDEPFLQLRLRLPNGAKETISIRPTNTVEVSIRNIPLIL